MTFLRVLPLIAFAALAGCTSAHRPPTQGEPVLKLARAAQTANPNGSLSSEANLAGLARVPVTGESFETTARSAQIERFPCARCHDRPLAQMKRAPAGQKSAHWEIELKHAGPGVMSCESCHHTQGETNSLHTLRGDPVSFDHSYQLCAQCHARQLADWKGGAHGKRLGGWAPPRVVQNCTGCHDPHAPAFHPRWPSVATGPSTGAKSHE
jgi:hypothetical protein